MKEQYPGETNPYKSPFQSVIWLFLILLVASITLIVVTVNNGFSIYNLITDQGSSTVCIQEPSS